MIEDDISANALFRPKANYIFRGLRFIAQAKSHVAHDDVRALPKLDPVISYCDAIVWGCLASQRESTHVFNAKFLIQLIVPPTSKTTVRRTLGFFILIAS